MLGPGEPSAGRARLRPAGHDLPPAGCRVCGEPELALYVHIPAVSPSGQLITASPDQPEPDPVSLTLRRCPRCGLVQHHTPCPEGHYDAYFSSFQVSELARTYQEEMARGFVSRFDLQGKSVVEVGSGDGMFLSFLRDAGAVVAGVERSRRAAEIGRAKGFEIAETGVADAARLLPGPLSGVASRHVLEHVEDVGGLLADIHDALQPGGALLVEVPAFEKTVEGRRAYDFCLDHVSYFSAASLALALERAGFTSVEVHRIVDGEMLVATARTPGHRRPPADWVGAWAGQFLRFARERLPRGQTIDLWGAGPKCLGLLAEIHGEGVRRVVDSDPLKSGGFTPAPRLPIVSPEEFMVDPSSAVVITAWSFRDEIARELDALGYEGEVLWLGPDGVQRVERPA